MPPKLHRTRGSDIMKYKTTTVSFWSRKFEVEWPLPLVLILVRGLRPITQHKEQKMKSIVLLIVASLSSQTCLGVKYEPNWNSIDSRPLPAWYDDVKIGMFINWGVYSVPSYSNEWFWYSWKGPKPDPRVVKLMEQFYPPTFTYADFAAEFKAEFYDPVKWVDIIKSSGAKWVSHDIYCRLFIWWFKFNLHSHNDMLQRVNLFYTSKSKNCKKIAFFRGLRSCSRVNCGILIDMLWGRRSVLLSTKNW